MSRSTFLALVSWLIMSQHGLCDGCPCCNNRGLLVDGDMYNIPNSKITASGSWSQDYEPYKARLSSTSSWVGVSSNAPNQYLEFNLGEPALILAIVTRGRPKTDQWLTTYNVKYSPTSSHYSGGIWRNAAYMPAPKLTVNPMVFPGNLDSSTNQINYLQAPIKAQYIRIYPVTYNQHISARADLIGCYPD